MAEIDIKGLDEFVAAIQRSPETAVPILETALERALLLVEGVVKQYPPQPARDRAKTFNTYVRGRGHYPLSAFNRGGKLKRGAKRDPTIRLTSERLGTKWTHQVDFDEAGAVGEIGNTASYADEVQGEGQADFHAETGWPTLPAAMDQQEQNIYDILELALNEILKKL